MSQQLVASTSFAMVNPHLFESVEVHTLVDELGELWFCALHVCQAMELKWQGAGKTLRNIPKSWVTLGTLPGEAGSREAIYINEAAVYRLVFRSNKPKAEGFANWVCSDVLPSIRKQGFWGQVENKSLPAYYKQIEATAEKLAGTNDQFLFELYKSQLRDLCNLVGRKMPDIKKVGVPLSQLTLELDDE